MLSFLNLNQPEEGKKLGELHGQRNIGEQLQELKGKVEKTMSKNKSELQKYRELTKFNEQMSKSYVANLKIIVDISTLLKGYNEIFDLFKSKIAEIDKELGIPISSNDFDYMKRLTTEQMVQLNDVFKVETSNLKKLYSKYGKQKEYEEVEVAERLFDATKYSGDSTYQVLKSPQTTYKPMFGGESKKTKPSNKKQNKKKKAK